MKRILSAMIFGVLLSPGFSVVHAAEARILDFEFVCNTPDGKKLKPKHGDIDGGYFIDLPAQRDQCRDSVDRKIAWCYENTVFTSNTLNQEYAECLPVFEKQAKECAAFFRREKVKCDGGGDSAQQQDAEQDSASGRLEGTGNWGLKEVDNGYVCTESGDSLAEFTWAGRCAGGKPTGQGALRNSKGLDSSTGSFDDGIAAGHWVLRFADGHVEEGTFVDDKRNGRWVLRYADGTVAEGPYVDGKRNGRWFWRYPDGHVEEGPFVDGKRNGRWNITKSNGTTFDVCWRSGDRVDC